MNDQPHFIASDQPSQDGPLPQMKDREQQTPQDQQDIRQIIAQVIVDFQSDLEYLRDC